MPRKDIYKDANGFDKNPQNINRKGRPKKIYTILKEKGFCKDDIITAFGELAFYNINELKKLYENKKSPVIVQIIAKAYYKALKDGDWNRIKEIMQYVLGAPSQKIDINTELSLTEKEIKKINKALEDEF